MANIFTKSYAKDTDGYMPADDLVVVGTSVDGTVFHWVFYARLADSDATRSVVFDMSPGTGEPPIGILLVSSVPGATSTGPEVLEYPFAPAAPITPDAFLDFIVARGLDKFKFTPEGTGCRNWFKAVISGMEEAGLATPGTADAFQAWLEGMSAKLGTERIPMPGARGTFYS